MRRLLANWDLDEAKQTLLRLLRISLEQDSSLTPSVVLLSSWLHAARLDLDEVTQLLANQYFCSAVVHGAALRTHSLSLVAPLHLQYHLRSFLLLVVHCSASILF